VTTSAAVAGGSLDDAAAIFLDLRVDQFAAKRLESRQRSFLVRRHQPRMASDVRCENGGQFALGLLRCHVNALQGPAATNIIPSVWRDCALTGCAPSRR
jgi:hypothetical protein